MDNKFFLSCLRTKKRAYGRYGSDVYSKEDLKQDEQFDSFNSNWYIYHCNNTCSIMKIKCLLIISSFKGSLKPIFFLKPILPNVGCYPKT